ncbi:chaperonin 10-like protein [Naematelia encephala]|uniref:Chaperonin 10-like protein n=1 Tax=Naematelia encephala TaxID=71784 RepID=A0A1Y2BGN0_9TREE|nr:chaperonin 10-like protein [Naematelia encephala]
MLFKGSDHDTVNPKDNLAFLMVGQDKLELKKREVPKECGPYEAIVCPKRTGICGSDMHILLSGMLGDRPFGDPFTLGHECAGIVAQVGDKVRDLKIGDRVALEPGEPCYRCELCKAGSYAQCEFMHFAAAGVDGTLQGYYTLPADLCYKLPENLSLEEGAMMEPLAVAINAIANVAEMRPAANVAIFGAGPVGLLTMAAAKALGARRIIAIDTNAGRLDFAKDYVNAETHQAIPMESGEDKGVYSRRHAEVIMSKFGLSDRGPTGIDVVVDCSGAEVCIQTGMWLLKRRGKFVQVGNGGQYCNIPMRIVAFRELTIKGVFRYGPGVYWMSIDLVSRGLINLKPLLTHRYSFNDVPKAFETAKIGKGEDGKMAIKVMIDGPEA